MKSYKKVKLLFKLNLINTKISKLMQSKIKLISLFSFIKFIIVKVTKIIKEWIPSKPLKPSIRLEPLIINKKHKQININEKKILINIISGAIPVSKVNQKNNL